MRTQKSAQFKHPFLACCEAGTVLRRLQDAGNSVKGMLQGKCPSCDTSAGGDDDPDAWLDSVGDHPPPIVPSHFGLVHGIEPFEQHDLKVG
jgi:hypothetical protein